MSLARLKNGLWGREAHTDPQHPDPSLRGRTYAIPFHRVWVAAFDLASGSLRGWRILEADEDRGVLRAEARTRFLRFVDEVRIDMSLDAFGQTRVDMTSSSKVGKSDLGTNARRVRRFFRLLDRKVGAGPETLLEGPLEKGSTFSLLAVLLWPLAHLVRLLTGAGPALPFVMALSALLGGCSPSREEPPPQEPSAADSLAEAGNFESHLYERNIVFLATEGDTALTVLWSFAAATHVDSLERETRGWLGRGGSWDPFFRARWMSPPARVPWRIVPHGPVRLIVGMEDVLETVYYREGERNLELTLGNLLDEWSGQQAQTYRLQRANVMLSDRKIEGIALDLSRSSEPGSGQGGDWGVLFSGGDTLQMVLESSPSGGGSEKAAYTCWARVDFVDRQWQGVEFAWTGRRAFEPARRDVPVAWSVRSPEGELEGELRATSSHWEVGEGEGPVLPVLALYRVSGTLTVDGREVVVQGFLHQSYR